MYERCTYDEVLLALNFVNPNMPRDEWAQIGMAIKNEFGDSGWDLFDRWSQGGESYNRKDCQSTWKSVKAYGKGKSVTINTVFDLAIDAGYTRENKQLSADEQAKRDAEYAARKARREAEAKAQQLHDTRWRDVVANVAREVWALLVGEGKCEYLKRKQVRGFGVRFPKRSVLVDFNEPEYSYQFITGQPNISEYFKNKTEHMTCAFIKTGTLVLPVHDANNTIFNLQVIHPAGKKVFLPGAKSGLFSWLVAPTANDQFILIGEGYATVASGHMATLWPAAVAFDSGNLPKVARVIRQLYPNKQLVILGDDDSETEINAGRKKALQAASEVGGFVVFPNFGVLLEGEFEQHAA